MIHYDIPDVDRAAYRLTVDGHVERPLTLSLHELRGLPRVTAEVTMECAGNGRALLEPRAISQPWLRGAVGNAEWTGTPLLPLLERAGIRDGAVDVAFTGLDRGFEGGREQDYERGLSVAEAMHGDLLLAYEMNGRPLLPQHGAPVRLLVPGWYGMASVKWLDRIRVLDEPFTGYQNTVAYRMRADADDPGTPLDRIRVRSLMVPPGRPSFQPRDRHVDAGPVRLTGRAWSGTAPIVRVEVSTDGGASWNDAELGPEPPPSAWRSSMFEWLAIPGTHVVSCRATDAAG